MPAGVVESLSGLHVPGQPLMFGVGDDDLTIGERDGVARATIHHIRGSDHRYRLPVGSEQQISYLNLAHGGPARRGRQRGIEGERLTDTRPGRHDDHLPGVEAVGQRVQIGEAGGHAGGHAAAAGDGVHLVHRRLQQLLENDVILGRAPFGDFVDLRLGAVDDLVDLPAPNLALVAAVTQLDDPGAGLDEPPQDGLLRHDLGVERRVGSRRHRTGEGVQVDRTADSRQSAGLVQFGGDGHHVGRLAAGEQVEDDLVDRRVRRLVEVDGAQLFHDIGDGVLAEQHAAEDRLLGGQVLRRLPVELARRVRRACSGPPVVDHRHLLCVLSPYQVVRSPIGVTISDHRPHRHPLRCLLGTTDSRSSSSGGTIRRGP